MNKFFEINPGRKENNDSPSTFSLGIKMKIGNLETICTVTEDLSYGLSRLFEVYREEDLTRTKVFRENEKALEWLRDKS